MQNVQVGLLESVIEERKKASKEIEDYFLTLNPLFRERYAKLYTDVLGVKATGREWEYIISQKRIDNKIKIDSTEDLMLLFDVAEERFFTKERSKEKCRTNSYERIGD